MEQSPLSVYAFINLVCVQSVILLMNTPFITLYHGESFPFVSRVIIVQDLETVTLCYLYTNRPSVIFCSMKRLSVSSQFNSLHPIHFHNQTFQISSKGVH